MTGWGLVTHLSEVPSTHEMCRAPSCLLAPHCFQEEGHIGGTNPASPLSLPGACPGLGHVCSNAPSSLGLQEVTCRAKLGREFRDLLGAALFRKGPGQAPQPRGQCWLPLCLGAGVTGTSYETILASSSMVLGPGLRHRDT